MYAGQKVGHCGWCMPYMRRKAAWGGDDDATSYVNKLDAIGMSGKDWFQVVSTHCSVT